MIARFWGACGEAGCTECLPLFNAANEPITGVILYGTGNAHFDQWVDSLATTDLPQGQSRLVTINQEYGTVQGYCCMGEACVVMGLRPSIFEEDTSDWDQPLLEGETVYDEVGAFAGFNEMAPPELLDWLGISHDGDQADIFVDLPAEYTMVQGAKVRQYPGDPAAHWVSAGEYDQRTLGCSTLNDQYLLTFAQIADVLRYFGIKDTVIE